MAHSLETKQKNRLQALRDLSGECSLRQAYQIAKGTSILDMPISELFPVQKSKTLAKPGKAWESWPAGLLEEITLVLAGNDSGDYAITMEGYLGRVQTQWGLDISPSTFRGYMKVLDRKGWAK